MRSVNPKRVVVNAQHVACLIFVACVAMAISQAQASDSWTLSGPEHTREGYFQLSLERNDDASGADNNSVEQVVIELSRSSSFERIDNEFSPLGSFTQLSLSGFDDGVYYFRARMDNDTYSNVHRVEVTHYPLWQALSIFGVGAVVFISLLVTLLTLHRRYRSAT